MFDRIKNLKLVKQLKDNVSPRLRWLSFSNKNKLDKSTTDYLEAVSGVDNLKSLSDEQELEAMVRAQLKEEFPNIESMKSYELLVDAVMHNIKKKTASSHRQPWYRISCHKLLNSKIVPLEGIIFFAIFIK